MSLWDDAKKAADAVGSLAEKAAEKAADAVGTAAGATARVAASHHGQDSRCRESDRERHGRSREGRRKPREGCGPRQPSTRSRRIDDHRCCVAADCRMGANSRASTFAPVSTIATARPAIR